MRPLTGTLSAVAASAFVALACASAPQGPPLEFGGAWRFSGVAAAPLAGTIEFLPDRFARVTCDGESPRATPIKYEVWANSEARVPACGTTLRVRHDDDGGLYGLVQASTSSTTRVTNVCTERGASGQCIRYEDRRDSRDTRGVDVRIEMTPIGRPGGSQ